MKSKLAANQSDYLMTICEKINCIVCILGRHPDYQNEIWESSRSKLYSWIQDIQNGWSHGKLIVLPEQISTVPPASFSSGRWMPMTWVPGSGLEHGEQTLHSASSRATRNRQSTDQVWETPDHRLHEPFRVRHWIGREQLCGRQPGTEESGAECNFEP